LLALEGAGLYQGVYHVLLGAIRPLDDIDAGDLTIEPLMTRLEGGAIRELIMGTNPTVEGTARRCTFRTKWRCGSERQRYAAGARVARRVEHRVRESKHPG